MPIDYNYVTNFRRRTLGRCGHYRGGLAKLEPAEPEL